MTRKKVGIWFASVNAGRLYKVAVPRGAIVLICGLFLYLILSLVTPLITAKSMGPTMFGNDIPVKNPDTFVVVLTLNEEESNRLNLRLAGIIAPKKTTSQDACVNGFDVDDHWRMEAVTTYFPADPIADLWSPAITKLWNDGRGSMMWAGGTLIGFGFSRLCPQDQAGIVNERMLDQLAINPDLSNRDFTLRISAMSEFFFPFDQRFATASVWLDTVDGKRIAPQVVGLSSTSQWDTKIRVSKVAFDGVDGAASKLEIVYSRPIAYRILSVVILSALFSVIVALVFVSDLKIAVSVLLGLWGVRSILVPPEISGTTIINALILTLYVLLGFALFLRYIVRPIWIRLGTSSEPTLLEKTDQPQERQKPLDAESQHSNSKTG